MSRVKDLIMITNYDDLEESSVLLDTLFSNNKNEIDSDLEKFILGESLLYGNYFTYHLLDDKLKTKEVIKVMKDSVIERIDSLLEFKELEEYKEQIIEPLFKSKKLIQNNYTNKNKMYELFQEYAILEFCALNLLNLKK